MLLTSAWSRSFSCLSSCWSCSISRDISSLYRFLPWPWFWRPLECKAISRTWFCGKQRQRSSLLNKAALPCLYIWSHIFVLVHAQSVFFQSPNWKTPQKSYFIIDLLQLFVYHCNIMFEGIPLLLKNIEVGLKTSTLMVHGLKSFICCLHLQWRKEMVFRVPLTYSGYKSVTYFECYSKMLWNKHTKWTEIDLLCFYTLN